MQVAFLGTGLLGGAMAEAMLRRGEQVRVWNRTRHKAASLEAFGAEVAEDPRSAVAGAERVHLCLADDAAVDSVLAAAGDQLRGKPVIDHSTVLPARVAQRAARLDLLGAAFLPAPVFMGPSQARESSGILLASGPRARFDAFEPWLTPMATRVWYLGDGISVAAGYKLLGNLLNLSMVGVLSDAFQCGRGAGLPDGAVLELLESMNPGGGLSWRAKRMMRGGYDQASFELSMARKDVRLMLETAGSRPMMVLPAVAAAMDEHLAAGSGAMDWGVIADLQRS